MIEIRTNYALPATQLDYAPKPASRSEPRDMPATKTRSKVTSEHDRRSNPDRRQRRGKERLDQRTGADRRRNMLDIKV
jgi:hypothetical protein